jgi:hypothetical protein
MNDAITINVKLAHPMAVNAPRTQNKTTKMPTGGNLATAKANPADIMIAAVRIV